MSGGKAFSPGQVVVSTMAETHLWLNDNLDYVSDDDLITSNIDISHLMLVIAIKHDSEYILVMVDNVLGYVSMNRLMRAF